MVARSIESDTLIHPSPQGSHRCAYPFFDIAIAFSLVIRDERARLLSPLIALLVRFLTGGRRRPRPAVLWGMAAGICLLVAPVLAIGAGSVTRLSTDAQPDTAYTASVSSDGRYLAFSTATPGLVPGDNDALLNVFVYDRQTQTTEAVDVTSAGVRANSYSQSARISRDGRYVLFDSAATNLAGAPDTNARDDVFLRDRVAGTTERVNVSTGGGQAFWFSNGMMTPDARFIAIGSDGLSVDDHTFFDDVYVRDRQTGVTELVSVSSAGVEPTDANTYVSDISPDGRFVVMWSNSAELVPGDTNGVWDVFVRDRLLGTTERVSLSSTGAEIGGSTTSWNQVSADGRYVAFSQRRLTWCQAIRTDSAMCSSVIGSSGPRAGRSKRTAAVRSPTASSTIST